MIIDVIFHVLEQYLNMNKMTRILVDEIYLRVIDNFSLQLTHLNCMR